MKQIALSILTLLSLTSCRERTDPSNVKHGALDACSLMFSLLTVPPTETLFICPDANSHDSIISVRNAILKWAKPIGRDRFLDIQKGCPENNSSYRLDVRQTDGGLQCTKGTLAYWTRPEKCYRGSQIVLCRSIKSSRAKDAVILHEIGHAWGMCDQYKEWFGLPIGRRHHQNCDEATVSARPGHGVMSNHFFSDPLELAEDDIEGIRKLAKTDDIYHSNEAWRKFLGDRNEILD